MDEQIDAFERQTRLKELQLALLRGDITLAEHDRRRARYEPTPEPAVAPRAVTIAEALTRGDPILDPLGNRLHYPGEAQYESWREEQRMAVPERRKVSKFGQWLGRWMKH